MHNKFLSFLKFSIISFLLITSLKGQENPQHQPAQLPNLSGYPVVLDKDTLFYIYNGIGPFSAEKRAGEISIGLKNLVEKDSLIVDSLSLEMQNGMAFIRDNKTIIMAITPEDTLSNGKSLEILSGEYLELIKEKVETTKYIYSQKSVIEKLVYIALFFIGFILLMWINRLVFPRIYAALEKLEGKVFKSFSIRKFEILKGTDLIDITTIIMKGLRLFITLAAIYSLLVFTVTNLPWTRHWYIQPILRGILLFIFVTVVAFVLIKGVNVSYRYFTIKYRSWKGTLIKSFKIKSVEILSEDKAVDMLDFITKIGRILLWLIIGYFYITLVFSFFEFSRTWASELIYYILNPLNKVVMSIINFLPNLFFIIVIITVFNYLIKFVKYFFTEIEKENIKLPGFHVDWASSTYKIVRFMIIVLAIIIIFPYLPGSDSEAFKGVSVFLGILFSLGSTSAISNIVAGTVLTYMRPFRLGDRVKIADTIGDVVEKTLLVTRVRTVKNVEISIPNSMVLGSHIVNYSTVAHEMGLILHTTVTIGYDVPWKQVHELLISAALETDNISKTPAPFVLQTSLDDFYVSYELNAYTDQPGIMAKTYSMLHSKIQDKFNEGGVEIMSPHYGAMRDGNQTTIPTDYLPKEYQAPSFRLFGLDLFGNKNNDNK